VPRSSSGGSDLADRSVSMTEMHNTRFHVLDAMAAVEREI
jgi:hypothetical protein